MAALESIGFQWEIHQTWMDMYQVLKQDHDENGDCNVHTTSTKLGRWVNKQRHKFKQGKLDDEQIAALESLGFVWQLNKRKISPPPPSNMSWPLGTSICKAFEGFDGLFNGKVESYHDYRGERLYKIVYEDPQEVQQYLVAASTAASSRARDARSSQGSAVSCAEASDGSEEASHDSCHDDSSEDELPRKRKKSELE